MIAGSLTYNTEMDTKGFQKGINDVTKKTKSAGTSIKSIIAGLGITQIISKAFGLITSNIDNAVKRLDTLNNFPKVMRNLGIGANESTEAIKQLSDNLQGLPTTLNDGALAVQRFTSKNGDVKKSVELFTAVNNAILAGGASADLQATALEQLSQAYAKGKPDMMEWRSIQTAMPAQLKQVAQAMGYISTDELGEELRKGKVSMDDFMDTIVELNKKGTGEFLSFEEQARNSVSGIGTSLQNMKTAVIRGVATIVQSIDTSLKNAGFGGISDIITKIGQSIESALKKVAEFIERIDWKKVVETIKSIIPVLSAVVTGFLAMKAIESISAFINRTVEGVNALGMALNLLMAHPIIAVITAVVAALIILYQKCEAFRNMVNDMLQKLKSAFMDMWKKIKPSLEELWEAMKELWEAIKPIGQFLLAVLIVALKVIAEILVALIPILADIIKLIVEFSTKLIQNIIQIVNAIINFFTKTIPDAFNNFITTVQNFVSSVIDWFKNLPYNLGVLVGEMIGFIFKFGVDAWNWVINELPKIIQGIIQWFQELPGRIWNFLLQTINRIASWGASMAQKGKEGSKNLFNNIVDTLKNLPNRMLELGRNIVEGLWNGIKNAKDWIIDKLKSFTNGIVDGMKDAMGIHSPSTLFRDQIGKFIPQGIAVGIELDTIKAVRAIDDMNDKIVSEMNKAVAYETGKMNASANIKANSMFNNTIVLNATFDGNVELNRDKVGRLIAPIVTKTIRTAGV